MRRSPLRQLWPSTVELWYIAFAAGALIVAGTGKLALEQAGLLGSAHLIGQQVSTKVIWGTNLLDTFSFTASATNLLIWGVVGLIVYGVLQAAAQALRTVQYQRDLGSADYIHPQGFTSSGYWRHILADTLLGFVLLVLLASATLAFIAVAVPNSFAYVRRFLVAPSWLTALDTLLGLAITFVGTLVLYLLLKLAIRHHQLAALED